jgi:peptidoglycan/xylan/chitin deacetylase (PgdA/CDA1 family)
MFVVSGLTGDQSVCKDDKEYLTWQELREMHAYGIRIGSHTVTHPELCRLSPSQIEFEIRQSKETIENKLGESIRSFSYPYAFPEQNKKFVEMLKDLLQTHGYEEGVTTIIGTASHSHDWFFLPRLPVNSFDDLEFLKAKLNGAYDWLHSIQFASKFIKAVTS